VRQLLTGGFTCWPPYSAVHHSVERQDDLVRQRAEDSRVWPPLALRPIPPYDDGTTWCVGERRIHAFGRPLLCGPSNSVTTTGRLRASAVDRGVHPLGPLKARFGQRAPQSFVADDLGLQHERVDRSAWNGLSVGGNRGDIDDDGG